MVGECIVVFVKIHFPPVSFVRLWICCFIRQILDSLKVVLMPGSQGEYSRISIGQTMDMHVDLLCCIFYWSESG